MQLYTELLHRCVGICWDLGTTTRIHDLQVVRFLIVNVKRVKSAHAMQDLLCVCMPKWVQVSVSCDRGLCVGVWPR